MMTGILTTMFIVTSPLNPNTAIQEMRNWESERTRTPVEEMINNSLQEMEWEEDKIIEKEEVIELPNSVDRQGIYDRCNHRSWIRFIQKRMGRSCIR